MVAYQVENRNKGTEIALKKNLIEISELESIVIETKNLLEGFYSTFELTEAIICKPEDMALENIQTKEQRTLKQKNWTKPQRRGSKRT